LVTTLQGENMAKIQYTGNERNRSLVKGGSISPKETLTVDAKLALVYLGDTDFKITFDASDRATLNTCSEGQYKWLQREFKGKTLSETLDKMFTVKPKKTIIPKKKVEPKTETKPKEEVKKPKPLVLKKTLEDSEL